MTRQLVRKYYDEGTIELSLGVAGPGREVAWLVCFNDPSSYTGSNVATAQPPMSSRFVARNQMKKQT
jgi:hypothetical protein